MVTECVVCEGSGKTKQRVECARCVQVREYGLATLYETGGPIYEDCRCHDKEVVCTVCNGSGNGPM